MFLYNLTLQKATGVVQAVHGNFSGGKLQEILLAKGKLLELVRPDPNTGKVHSLLTTEVFGNIRSIMAFRLTGGTKDYVVVGSDSGRIVILEYLPAKNQFERVHMETFGKSGCRRIVPGQYLAVDPKGRAIMIGAVEKQKLVFIMNRDTQARLTISSPLEAHKSNTLVYTMVGVDVGFENPTFACIEIDYEEADQDATGQAVHKARQLLTFYELDLGLNHVVRKHAEPLEESANALIAVPGGNDGPSGVLICSENYITYKNFGDQLDIRCPIPRRRNDLDDPERGMMFVCSTTHKTRSMFFFLVQTEQGDIFKITLDTDEDMVHGIRMKYFDTVPVAASMCVLKTGFLFVASEFGNHYLYQIAHLGDDDDEPEFSTAMPLEEGDTFYFAPRPLRNLIEVDEIESLSPILAGRVTDLANDDSPQIYTMCGRGPRSTVRVLRHGLEVSEMAKSDLPGSPNAVWTVKRTSEDEYDAYIIVSFVNATLVLSIGETVEEVTDSGFLGTTPTLNCAQLGEDALVQIYPEGIRHIRSDKRVNVWRTPGSRTILKCAVNQRQVVIALTGNELVYFAMDSSGTLNEFTERRDMPADVVCMAMGQIPSGEQQARFLAVGLADQTVRVLSLDPSSSLQFLTTQALPSIPESLCIAEMGSCDTTEGGDSNEKNDENGSGPRGGSVIFLNTGLQNGVLLRAVLDPVSGELSDTRTRYLGSRPVKLFHLRMHNSQAVLAVSSRTWLSYTYQGRFHLTPLSYEMLEYAAGFASEQCPEGIVALCCNSLRILALEKLGALFNQLSHPLEYTPRKFVIHPESRNLIIIETDHNAYTQDMKMHRKREMAEKMMEAPGEETKELAREMAAAFLAEDLPEKVFGAPKAGSRMWASVIVVMNPASGEVVQKIPLPQNEAAHSIALCKFLNRGDEQFVVVGTVRDLLLNPRTHEGGCIHTFQVVNKRTGELALLHETAVDDMPGALCPFNGRLLAGIGRRLRLFELGKKKLLKKCENKHIPNLIVGIQTVGQRILVADVQESLFWLRYQHRAGSTGESQMAIFADNNSPGWTTCFRLLDASTAVCADKFGNVAVLRLPSNCTDEVEDDPSGNRALWDRGVLGGASQKMEMVCHFYVGEVLTSLERTILVPGGSECILYTTLSGSVGCLMPFSSRENHDLMQHLELHLRSENVSLVGRDHLHFRSYYFPCRNVVDGDLCEYFNSLEPAKQKTIAEELDKTPSEISKRLEDLRTRYAF